MIFERYERTDSSPKLDGEREFAFLDRSARPEIGRVRDFLETLIFEYPEEYREGLVVRIRSGEDAEFASATFELLLFGLLTRLDYQPQPHPILSNGIAARPDFLVRGRDGHEFFLEAVCVTSRTAISHSSAAMMGTTLDCLRSANHPSFRVLIQTSGAPKTQPSGKRLCAAVLAWLDGLDPDSKRKASPWTWTHEGWHLRFSAIPIPVSRRGLGTTLVGGLTSASWVNNWAPISDGVRDKGRKYGDLGQPLVIAVNTGTFHVDVRDELQALFGQETFAVPSDRDAETILDRAPNGAFRGPKGPRGTRVSGVWIFNNLSPYTIAQRRHMLYVNPCARYELAESLRELPRTVVVDGWAQPCPGISLRAVFGLPAGWPEREPTR